MSVQYEPFSEAVRDDPYPVYAALRERAPVYWAEGAQAFCVSRYADVQHVLTHRHLHVQVWRARGARAEVAADLRPVRPAQLANLGVSRLTRKLLAAAKLS